MNSGHKRSGATIAPWVVAIGLALAASAGADPQGDKAEAAKKEGMQAEAAKPAEAPAKPQSFTSEHRLESGDLDLRYTATAEEIFLKDAAGKPTASFFTISYTKAGVARPEDRPVTFVFNGGPGSSSIWLHFGLVGPRIIDLPSDASDPGPPPYKLRDNPWTLLRATDLVFVDPVGTGYSKALGEKKNADFWGFDEDADSVAEMIRTWLSQHNRWNSPKFTLGESYGGIRTALLVPRLQQGLDLRLNGVMLISPALNMATLPFDITGNDLAYATELPSLAVAAYYHHRLPDAWPSLPALLSEVEGYAGGEYLSVLFAGDRLAPADRERAAERLHRYTGLGKDYILRSNLRIFPLRFIKELLREQGKILGFHDSRFVQDELDDVGDFPAGDAFAAKTNPVYVANFQSYLKNELKVDWDQRYIALSDEAGQNWKRPKGTGAFSGYVNVTDQLAQGTKDNEALRVFVAAGYHDLVTPFFATDYMFHHSRIDPGRLMVKAYPGGHMMYLHQPSLEALANDLVAFIGKH
ncbi:MAG TPA: peptidase S10 [Thermoanaerobaculia bacterium]|nr:peptidase S10 [Thermoanaerobaculia bacterium]